MPGQEQPVYQQYEEVVYYVCCLCGFYSCPPGPVVCPYPTKDGHVCGHVITNCTSCTTHVEWRPVAR